MASVTLCLRPLACRTKSKGTSHHWGLTGKRCSSARQPCRLQSSLCSGASWALSQHQADQNVLQSLKDISIHIILAKFYTVIMLRPWTLCQCFCIRGWPANLFSKGPESKHIWVCRPCSPCRHCSTLIQGTRTLVQTICTDMGGATCQNFMMTLECKFHVMIHGSCNFILLSFPTT